MIADEPKGHAIAQLEDNAIMNIEANFPVIPMKILQPQPWPQRSLMVKIGEERVNSGPGFLLTLG